MSSELCYNFGKNMVRKSSMKHYGVEIFKDLDQSFEDQFIKYGRIVSFKRRETPFLDGELSKYLSHHPHKKEEIKKK